MEQEHEDRGEKIGPKEAKAEALKRRREVSPAYMHTYTLRLSALLRNQVDLAATVRAAAGGGAVHDLHVMTSSAMLLRQRMRVSGNGSGSRWQQTRSGNGWVLPILTHAGLLHVCAAWLAWLLRITILMQAVWLP